MDLTQVNQIKMDKKSPAPNTAVLMANLIKNKQFVDLLSDLQQFYGLNLSKQTRIIFKILMAL